MTILTQLFEIIILKRKPQDIAYDVNAAVLAFLAALACSYFGVVATGSFAHPLPFVLVQGVTQTIIFFLLLSITKKQQRFTQTITALFGVSAILQFIGLIVLQVPGLGIFGLIITSWNFYLMILILREAIECSTLQSIILTILYHFVIGLVLLMLFPDIFAKMQAMVNATQSV